MVNVQYVGENAVNKPVTGRDQYVIIDRKAKAGVWTTLCLPFDISKGRIEYVFGKESVVQRFSGVTTYGDGWTALNFSPVDDIKAGTPYTTASGEASHAEGRDTTASGHYSHVEGRDTTASGW